jgi:uncharacterized OB-fold protein
MQFCRKCGRSLFNDPEKCDSCGTPTHGPLTIRKAKVITPAKVYVKTEIKKSDLSIEEDVITNPQDYKHQVFAYDFKCQYDHYWPAGKPIPVSKGKAYCPECGERLRKVKVN